MKSHLYNPADQCEIELKRGASGIRTLEGYLSKFNSEDSHRDTVVPGAFKKTLSERTRPMAMNFEHMYGMVIGKFTKMEEDTKGLHVIAEFTPGNSNSDNAYALAKHGVIGGLSIEWAPYKSIFERKLVFRSKQIQGYKQINNRNNVKPD